MIDQKKDKRLAYLLSQTDEYITNMMSLLAEHKEDIRKKKMERKKKKKGVEAVNPEVILCFPCPEILQFFQTSLYVYFNSPCKSICNRIVNILICRCGTIAKETTLRQNRLDT